MSSTSSRRSGGNGKVRRSWMSPGVSSPMDTSVSGVAGPGSVAGVLVTPSLSPSAGVCRGFGGVHGRMSAGIGAERRQALENDFGSGGRHDPSAVGALCREHKTATESLWLLPLAAKDAVRLVVMLLSWLLSVRLHEGYPPPLPAVPTRLVIASPAWPSSDESFGDRKAELG